MRDATKPTKQFLNDDIIRDLPPPARGAKIHRDADHPDAPGTGVIGYGVRVTRTGAKALVLEYRDRETGDQKTYTIGRWPRVRVERGREIARGLRAKIEEGRDPQGERTAKRREATVNDLIDRFEREHLPNKRASTAENYARLLKLYIRPALGKMRIGEVEMADADKLIRAVAAAGKPYQANRVAAVGSKLFTSAIRWKLRTQAQGNPFKYVEKSREHHRRRYASADELRKLIAAVNKHPDRAGADAIKLLLLTGARRGEILGLAWRDLDLDGATWNRQPEHLKQNAPHSLPLSPPAVALLRSISDAQSHGGKRALGEYVFAGAGAKGHLVAIRRLWRNVVGEAGLENFRIHDLRHSVASQLISSGASLALVGSLLGHSNPSTTSRYAHLYDSVEREAVGKIGDWALAAGLPEEAPPRRSATVTEFPRKRRAR
jgi:integrase